ncbi:hypothetical protein conserved [Leishmania donovani]|uniref:Hypothetical_protein_conserved n=1 Tax=Leishmania donovani TaxID=5661 RepID=A0A3S7WPG5_LEIDO|nr:hypothetical protein, conserved [Leishmania donovani]AYU76085.1 hypothetical protein LdCL_060010600 [Leishmania donovani]TPP49776.1 hypothetical protein CGC20_20090 [Leishmania donovani]TPP54852.1 hypothetical protein CGC21_24295 [Leishmania donovani]CAJ1986152.1 hypothetical protein conserved [Leishmania donovani]CBZ31638.1 hypothetical protein, conserved [Leishmania donovani]
MSSHAFSSGSAPNVSSATTGTVAQQADTLTRNLILGIPKEGLSPNSPEAADLQAAEAFVSDIQQEILAYDIANAKAIESYAVRWWSAVPFFGRHAKRALEAESTAAATAAAGETHKSTEAAAVVDGNANSSEGHGLRLSPEEAAAALQSGGAYLHRQASQTPRGFKVERTSAIDPAQLSQLTGGARCASGSKAVPVPKVNTWLFRRQHPSWVPLMQRWWVPWLCCGSIVLIWTPDVWKLRTLYFCDHQYALLRQSIHKAYWWATMAPEDYAAHMAAIAAERPSRVRGTSCPFE